jgi:hypothetical protein
MFLAIAIAKIKLCGKAKPFNRHVSSMFLTVVVEEACGQLDSLDTVLP